jgi:hypothetical protein
MLHLVFERAVPLPCWATPDMAFLIHRAWVKPESLLEFAL